MHVDLQINKPFSVKKGHLTSAKQEHRVPVQTLGSGVFK